MSPKRRAAWDGPLFDPTDGELGPLQGTVGMRGLRPDIAYQCRELRVQRVLVSEPPCGKPAVESLPNGELVAAYARNYWGGAGPLETKRPLMNEVRWSTDGGMSWSEPVRPFPLEETGPTYEGRLIVMRDGRLVMATIAMQEGRRPGPYLSVSCDQGRHWCRPWKVDLSAVWRDGNGWPCRQNIAQDDGSLVLFCNNYAEAEPPGWPCYAFHLDAELHSVRDLRLVGLHCYDQSFIRLRSGTWAAALRMSGLKMPRDRLPYGYVPAWNDGNEGHDYLAFSESRDEGRTWSSPHAVTGYMEVPGHLMELADGRLLLTYGVRHYPMGAQALLSRDGGATWDRSGMVMLFWNGAFAWNARGLHPYPNGHPFSAQRQDGRIVTLSYRTADPRDYRSTLVEAVIWEVPAP